MSWGSRLAEGERNGEKASTQVGHGSRWDTDCSVVYSCWGPSTLPYRGQKLCLSSAQPLRRTSVSLAEPTVNIRQGEKNQACNFFLCYFPTLYLLGTTLNFSSSFFSFFLLQVFFCHADTPGVLMRRRIIREKNDMRKCKRVTERKPSNIKVFDDR